jgi:hypothetical protein
MTASRRLGSSAVRKKRARAGGLANASNRLESACSCSVSVRDECARNDPPGSESPSTQPRQSTSRSPVDTLRATTAIPIARFQAPLHTLPRSAGQHRAHHHNGAKISISLAAARRSNLPATSCSGAYWTPAAGARGPFRDAGVQKPAHGRTFLNMNRARAEGPFWSTRLGRSKERGADCRCGPQASTELLRTNWGSRGRKPDAGPT